MICPYCYEECDALFIHPELGLICPRCRDKEISEAAAEIGAEGTIPIVDDADFDLPDYDWTDAL